MQHQVESFMSFLIIQLHTLTKFFIIFLGNFSRPRRAYFLVHVLTAWMEFVNCFSDKVEYRKEKFSRTSAINDTYAHQRCMLDLHYCTCRYMYRCTDVQMYMYMYMYIYNHVDVTHMIKSWYIYTGLYIGWFISNAVQN